MKRGIVICLISLVLMFTFVSADFDVGDPSHLLTQSAYSPGSLIEGWINISLNNESADSLFEDSNSNSISLVDLLEENSEFDYSCSTTDCTEDYSATKGELSKSYSVDIGGSKITGFKFEGDITDIVSISFKVESDAATSCYNQLRIDFLNDGIYDKGNDQPTDALCSILEDNGCFDEGEPVDDGKVGVIPYCQRVSLSTSPGFKVSTWMKKVGDTGKVRMSLHTLNGVEVDGASCEFPDASPEGGEVSCEIDYLNFNSEDYYVCISSDDGEGDYIIKGYSAPDDGCGFKGHPTGGNNEDSANNISIVGKKFAGLEGTPVEISNSLINDETLGALVKEYIMRKYGSLNCFGKDCVVPIRIRIESGQTITVSNLSINYKVGTYDREENSFYDLEEIPATVNSVGFQKLYLNKGNFTAPSGYGGSTFNLKLGNEEVFSDVLTTQNLPQIKFLTPTKTASAYPTPFEVEVDFPGNISKYKWDFGDNQTLETPTNKVVHTYTSTGDYKLRVEITDKNQRTSYKIFDIFVGSPGEIINSTLEKMAEDLINIGLQIKDFSEFSQKSLETVIRVDTLDSKVKQIKRDFKAAYSEEELNKILTDLLALKVPESLTISKKTDLITFYPNEDYINLNILGSIDEEGNISEEGPYIDAILLWNQENLETRINFKEILATYDDFEDPILSVFDVVVKREGGSKYNPYFIIRKLDGLEFEENYLESEENGYIYIELNQDQETISFSTTENIDFTELPLFISPPISRLSLADNSGIITEGEDDTSKWVLFFIVLFIILVIGFVVYIVLQEWYKRRYEGYLFKDRNDLYNMAAFIHNAESKGLREGAIKNKLRKAGWNSEQTTYAVKKYLGKRTGMLEIPIDKFLAIFKRKKVKKVVVKKKSQISKGYLGPKKAFKRY
ncbi:PKD domain-containing protein [Candidatus Pacearchaeota archaeon]|nr:PKD domain-containing protein [Candidatus Pacearchaeota archaeon]